MKKLNKKQILIILVSTVIIIVTVGIIIGVNIKRTNIINNDYSSADNGSNNENLIPKYIKKGITLGGVTGTLESLDTSDATATAMDITYGKTAYVNGEKIEGLFVPRSSLKVGDYVSYIPDTTSTYSIPSTVSGYESEQTIEQENLMWQILNINGDGTIDLISSEPNSQMLYFKGALGYNNAVYLLNDICSKLYSNEELKLIARNINLEDDIEPKMNEEGINARNSYGYYGTAYTITNNNRYYPNLYKQEKGSGIDTGIAREDGIAKNDSYYETTTTETSTQAGNSLTATSDYYYMVKSETTQYFNDEIWYDIVFNKSNYWLASRCTDAYTGGADFYLRFINKGALGNNSLFYSNNIEYDGYASFRPIVTLSLEIIIYGGDGSQDAPYKLAI